MSRSVSQTTIVYIAIIASCKLLGFLRDVVMAYFYGTSSISDAYMISLVIPASLFSIFGACIETIFIPRYTSLKILSPEKSRDFTNALNRYIFILCFAFLLLGLIFSKLIVSLYAPGFDVSTATLAVKMTRLSLFAIPFLGSVYVLKSYLRANNHFFYSEISGIPINLIIILSFCFSATYGPIYLSLGKVISIIFEFLFLILVVKISGFKFSLKSKLTKEDKLLWKSKSVPIFFGSSMHELNKLIDRSIASTLAVGGISTIVYSNRLISLVIDICVLPIATIVFPKLSNSICKNDDKEFIHALNDSINLMYFMLLPSTVIFIFNSTHIVSLIYGRGSFNSTAIFQTSWYLFFSSLGLIAIGTREIFTKCIFASGDTHLATKNTIIGLIVNIILNFIFSKFIGIYGLALATTISSILTSILLFKAMKSKFKVNFQDLFGGECFKLINSSIFSVFIPLLTCKVLDLAGIYYFIVFTFTYSLSYILFLLLFKSITLNELTSNLLVYFKNKRRSDD